MSSKVLVAMRVRAEPQRAFDAFTQEISQWWRPNSMFHFTPRSPGVVSFEDTGANGRLVETLPNGKVFEIGKIRVWEPPARLVVGWRQATFQPGQDTEVEVTFEPVGEETRITVIHSGWDSVPNESVAKHGFPEPLFLQRHGEYWRALLGELKSRVEG
jgi:uncharacterized protein YndB with AHSA1/START domain